MAQVSGQGHESLQLAGLLEGGEAFQMLAVIVPEEAKALAAAGFIMGCILPRPAGGG
jgi:hypothetical protein